MQKNYIILAHKNPTQLNRLLQRLSDDDTYFYIHIDRECDIEPFKREILLKNACFLEKRENTTWGDIGAVYATINGLRKIISDSRNGYSILLSGQDYPIKSNSSINSFLTDNDGINFIQFLPVSDAWHQDEGYRRLNKYKFNLSNRRGDFILLPWAFSKGFFTKANLRNAIRVLRERRNFQILHVLQKRKFPQDIRSYGGSQWWAITNETVSKIINFVDHSKAYVLYHKFTLLPDEIFFHSILKHLADNDKDVILQPSITYVNWTREEVTLPVTFTLLDLDELVNQPSSMLFARKFDSEFDSTILDDLDRIFHPVS